MKQNDQISTHPLFPFIEIGRAKDLAYSLEEMAYYGDDEWTFRLEGSTGPIARSIQDAIDGSEEQMFIRQPSMAEKLIAAHLESGDIAMAMRLSERRGYWMGKNDERARIHRHISLAIDHLKGIDRYYR